MAEFDSRKVPDQCTAETISTMAVVAPAVGWMIPGAGHMIQKRWIRGLLLFVSIVSLFLLGSRCRAEFTRRMAATFSTYSGFIGDMGAGGFYILTLAMDWGQGAIAFATADYGTKFMIVAGLLNFIAIADAYHIAIGKKQ